MVAAPRTVSSVAAQRLEDEVAAQQEAEGAPQVVKRAVARQMVVEPAAAQQ